MDLRKLMAFTVAVAAFAVIGMAAVATEPWSESGTGEEDMDALVVALFTDHVIALEVLGILLTAALIGALVIARPLGAIDDERHYDAAGMGAVSEEEE